LISESALWLVRSYGGHPGPERSFEGDHSEWGRVEVVMEADGAREMSVFRSIESFKQHLEVL
jgi:hypothetical protein